MKREIKFRAWDGCDKYRAGSDGKIYSTNFNHTQKTKSLKTYQDSDGYELIVLNISGNRIVKGVHRLVALAFHGEKPTIKHEINHKNKVRNDNRPENLEYLTHQENVIHSWQNGRVVSDELRNKMSARITGENNPKSKLKKSDIINIRLDRKNGLLLKDISKKYKISISQTGQICNLNFWKNEL